MIPSTNSRRSSGLPKSTPQKPEVIFQPQVFLHMQKGISQIIELIRPTLGPLPRQVAISTGISGKRPELLDNGGLIARRVNQLSNRDQDMGAMYVRHLLYEMYEKVGDGTATTAVLFQSIFNQGLRYITAGGNAVLLRKYLEQSVPFLFSELDKKKTYLDSKEELSGLAMTICHDRVMAKLMGEIFNILGAYGRLEIRKGKGRELEREYVEGMYWDGGLVSRDFITDLHQGRAIFEDASIIITDLEVKEPNDLLPVLELLISNGIKKVILMFSEITNHALSILLSPKNREKIEVVVVKTPGIHADDRQGALEDLSILTGGIPLLKASGDRLTTIKIEHLGQARRIWADLNNLVLIGGRGNARIIRQHIKTLRAAYQNAQEPDIKKRYLVRIGKLLGGSATLWIGGNTPSAIDEKKELAERTAEAMRSAIQNGVLYGGGIAFLDCREVLKDKIFDSDIEEQRMSNIILYRALETPTRVILENAGLESKDILSEIKRKGIGWGYDIYANELVEISKAGIWDSAEVVHQAIFSAVHGASLALTLDVLIHRRIRPESLQSTG
jgi:chaperonin GroEL